MSAPPVICVDFETHAIQGRPAYPPEAVGVAVQWPGQAGRYWAWRHPTENNCTFDEAMAELYRVWASGLPLLCHNAKFDLAVANEGLGLPHLSWERVHDTMFLAYLYDPHAQRLGLKELAEDLLHVPPDEQDEIKIWVWDNRRRLAETYGGSVVKSQTGAWIWATPAGLCGRYAVGDVERTVALFNALWPVVQDAGMGAAYDRERRLLPILAANERDGMRVDLALLEEHLETYASALVQVEDWLRLELKASGLNLDADRDVASVLSDRGIVADDAWSLTATGQRSMAKGVLTPKMFTGPNGAAVASALGYRNRLVTCTNMFMRPWAEQARARNGVISTNWNQTRGGESGGTRTGRPSTSNPNFLNLSKTFEGRSDGYAHPSFLPLPNLPLVRRYILPDGGHTFLHRDFSSQELRIFAHAEQGELHVQYLADPNVDVHAFVGDKIKELTGRELERTAIKILNFQALYGGGAPAAQRQLGCSLAEAKEYKAFHDKALPGRKLVADRMKRLARLGKPIRTMGGRLYLCEPPRIVDGQRREFDYKMLNYWVQGSAADYTKQAIIDWHEAKGRDARFLVTVYDEINISAPVADAVQEMRVLKEVMETPRFGMTVPMLSDAKHGPSWAELVKGEPQ